MANHVPCNHVSVCVSAKGLCFTPSFFVFKWTVNDFDVSVGTLAIRESTLASIPCQGLTLNWRAAVNKLVHTHTRDGLLQFVWGLFVVPITRCPANGKREEEGGAKRCSRRSLTRLSPIILFYLINSRSA